MNAKYVAFFHALERGLVLELDVEKTNGNPSGKVEVCVEGGVLFYAGDSPAQNALCQRKQQVFA